MASGNDAGEVILLYSLILIIHNLTRWAVLVLAAWALLRAWSGWLGGRPWTGGDRRAGLFFTMALDLQLLLGLALSLLSPLTRAAFADLGAAMGSDELRFLVAEHIPLMVLVVVLAHVGAVVSRKAADDRARHRRAALWYAVSALLMLLATPWWRPLLRLAG